MAASSPRGLKLLKLIQNYTKQLPNQYDTSMVFKKVQVISASEGQILGKFKVETNMCNAGDTLHGGYIATLIDVFALYGHLSHEKSKGSLTTHLNVIYFAPAFIGDEVSIESVPIQIGKPTVIDVILKNENSGSIIAKGSSTFVPGSGKLLELAEDRILNQQFVSAGMVFRLKHVVVNNHLFYKDFPDPLSLQSGV